MLPSKSIKWHRGFSSYSATQTQSMDSATLNGLQCPDSPPCPIASLLRFSCLSHLESPYSSFNLLCKFFLYEVFSGLFYWNESLLVFFCLTLNCHIAIDLITHLSPPLDSESFKGRDSFLSLCCQGWQVVSTLQICSQFFQITSALNLIELQEIRKKTCVLNNVS